MKQPRPAPGKHNRQSARPGLRRPFGTDPSTDQRQGRQTTQPITAMGTGCKEVYRVHTEGADVITGVWQDGRVGVFRGQRAGKSGYGGQAFGEKGNIDMGPYQGYLPLLIDVAHYFKTGEVPVTPEETIEIFAFMSAADVSKQKGGKAVSLEKVLNKAGA